MFPVFSVIYQKCVLNKPFIFIPSPLPVLHALIEPQPVDTFFLVLAYLPTMKLSMCCCSHRVVK